MATGPGGGSGADPGRLGADPGRFGAGNGRGAIGGLDGASKTGVGLTSGSAIVSPPNSEPGGGDRGAATFHASGIGGGCEGGCGRGGGGGCDGECGRAGAGTAAEVTTRAGWRSARPELGTTAAIRRDPGLGGRRRRALRGRPRMERIPQRGIRRDARVERLGVDLRVVVFVIVVIRRRIGWSCGARVRSPVAAATDGGTLTWRLVRDRRCGRRRRVRQHLRRRRWTAMVQTPRRRGRARRLLRQLDAGPVGALRVRRGGSGAAGDTARLTTPPARRCSQRCKTDRTSMP